MCNDTNEVSKCAKKTLFHKSQKLTSYHQFVRCRNLPESIVHGFCLQHITPCDLIKLTPAKNKQHKLTTCQLVFIIFHFCTVWLNTIRSDLKNVRRLVHSFSAMHILTTDDRQNTHDCEMWPFCFSFISPPWVSGHFDWRWWRGHRP